MSAQDPRNKFKTDNYEKQEQEVPGIQAKMSPQPDCGEDSYHGHHRLDGFKILVTGGDSAIGRAAAIAYAKEGADVAINYLPSEQQDADDVKQIIENVGQKAILIPGDIRDEQFNYDMVEKAYQQLGGLDNVTLVAGHQLYQDELSEFKTQDFTETFETNVYPVFWTVQKALEYLQPGGSITTTSSVQGYIRVNCVAPGPFWSPLQIVGGQPQSAIPTFGQNTPLGRAGQPVECAGTYVLLASDDASYITGQVYGVTGGTQID